MKDAVTDWRAMTGVTTDNSMPLADQYGWATLAGRAS
ncbi:hypothetical protein PC129_g11313 [Phytophthora cactorum]|uniref:Uncharacterized protein n=1 Tax=Phytophthora cactorum TaxID=29920 RepID=A0A8T1I1Y0_9STRA|nr:hypothetical protein PC129_g11313 [Phytophthora cactorum]